MFQPMPGDSSRMVNDRLEEIREEQRQKYLKRSAKGKVAADKRWHEHATGIPQAMPKQCHSESESDTEDSLKRESKERAPKTAKPASPKVRLPETFSINDEMREWAKTGAPDVDLDAHLEEFIVFWLDIASKHTKRTERGWQQTWRNRMTELQERRNKWRRNGTPQNADSKNNHDAENRLRSGAGDVL
jgi:hypothetical protein